MDHQVRIAHEHVATPLDRGQVPLDLVDRLVDLPGGQGAHPIAVGGQHRHLAVPPWQRRPARRRSTAYRVGGPAKSGVGGGIVAVVNRQLGIGVFSPRLDAAGNSIRGRLCCIELTTELGLHAFDGTNPGSSLLRSLAGHATGDR